MIPMIDSIHSYHILPDQRRTKMAGYIHVDTSDVNIAEVRAYWRDLDRSAAARKCGSDSESSCDSSSVYSYSTRSTAFAAPTTCADTTSTDSSSSFVNMFVNTSLFDGFNSDEPMLLMAVSSDTATCNTPSSTSVPPPFNADLSPIVAGSKKKSIETCKPKPHKNTTFTTTCTAVQEWPELATTNNMDKTPMPHTAPGVILYDRVHVSNIRKKYKEKRSARSANTKRMTGNTPLIATSHRSETNICNAPRSTFRDEEEVKNSTCTFSQERPEKKDAYNTAQQRKSKGRVAFGEWSSPENGATSTFSYPRLYQRLERRMGKVKDIQ